MIKPHNEPAFPSTGEGFNDPRYHTAGMSLRDYFAGQVLPICFGVHETCENIAKAAYYMADAMLEERTK